MEILSQRAGISSVRAVRVAKRALENGLELEALGCGKCKDYLLADHTPDRRIAWDELVARAGRLGRGPEDLLLELMQQEEQKTTCLSRHTRGGCRCHSGCSASDTLGLNWGKDMPVARVCPGCKYENTDYPNVIASPLAKLRPYLDDKQKAVFGFGGPRLDEWLAEKAAKGLEEWEDKLEAAHTWDELTKLREGRVLTPY